MIIEKKCRICGVVKPVSEYHKKKENSDGLETLCKSCRSVKRKEYYEATREHSLEVNRKWAQNNREKVREINKRIYEALSPEKKLVYAKNREMNGTSSRDYYRKNRRKIYLQKKEYRLANQAVYNARGAKRHASKLAATPEWLTEDHLTEMIDFYTAAHMFKLYTGTEYHVDHIVPLQGETVCGLHVPWNLQLLPWDENLSKQHRYWPDMPEQDNVKE